jgi:hypothetical protein
MDKNAQEILSIAIPGVGHVLSGAGDRYMRPKGRIIDLAALSTKWPKKSNEDFKSRFMVDTL